MRGKSAFPLILETELAYPHDQKSMWCSHEQRKPIKLTLPPPHQNTIHLSQKCMFFLIQIHLSKRFHVGEIWREEDNAWMETCCAQGPGFQEEGLWPACLLSRKYLLIGKESMHLASTPKRQGKQEKKQRENRKTTNNQNMSRKERVATLYFAALPSWPF